MTSITVLKPATVDTPRGAPVAADVARRLLDAAGSFLRAFRAQRAVGTRIAEANALRRHAQVVRRVDERVAHELMVAADRHEQQG